MSLGPIFVGFMFLFDAQIALQNEGAVHGIIDVFPDMLGYLIMLYGIKRYGKKHEFLTELEKFIYVPLLLSVIDFVLPLFFYNSFFDSTGENNLFFEIIEIFLLVSEAIFVFFLFGKYSAFTKGRKETPSLSGAFSLGRIFCISGLLISLSSRISRYFDIPTVTKYLYLSNYLFRVFFVWFGVVILFRAATKLSD